MAEKKNAVLIHERHDQSAWLDLIGRELIDSGELKRMSIEDGVRGVTANPAIFQKAIAESNEYDDQLGPLALAGSSPVEIYERLAITDIQAACDVLRPMYDDGRSDGFVSLEVAPGLAHDTAGTVAEAKRFWREVDRPNLLVKIPATVAGIPAIQQAIAAGVSVNITLIFSVRVHAQVLEAYQAGLEERVARGEPIDRIHSVASFFVSRVDSAVDKLLEKNGSPEAKALLGKIAIANAKEAYALYQGVVASDRWRALEEKGATRQRPLWASTGTKNKAYKDTLYADELIGPQTVNTLPLATLQAFNDHGTVAETITVGLGEARAQLAALAKLGIDLEKVCAQLTAEGVELFVNAFSTLGRVIDARGQALRETKLRREQLGARAAEGEKGLAAVREHKVGTRLWARDATLWGPAAEAQAKAGLGWLDLHQRMRPQVEGLRAFAREAAQRFDTCLWIGLGGSSLAAEALAKIVGKQEGGLALRVADSTAPDSVRAALEGLTLSRTLFVIASKTGTTIEVDALYRHFRSLADGGSEGAPGAAGAQFVAVTDPGTPLARHAAEQGFWRTFENPPDISGRTSALSLFGLLPAALLGADPGALLDAAAHAALVADPAVPPRDNLALRLGAIAAALAYQGPPSAADKLTFVLSPALTPLGPWLEQLVAESTGKGGRGIVPVIDATPGRPGAYGEDRLFVALRLAGETAGAHDAAVSAIEKSGAPLFRWEVTSPLAIGGEFLRWEIATIVAAAVMGIDPFGEPDVEAAKEKTRALLAGLEAGKLPPESPSLRSRGLALFAPGEHAKVLQRAAGMVNSAGSPAHWLAGHLSLADAGESIALLAWLPHTPDVSARLAAAQAAIRDKTRRAVTVSIGPRYLHAAGQLHKGGPPGCVFLAVTADGGADLEVPGRPWSFGTLFAAQARGDVELLAARGRRVLRVHLEDGDPRRLTALVDEALAQLA